jgi:hypothetical protein
MFGAQGHLHFGQIMSGDSCQVEFQVALSLVNCVESFNIASLESTIPEEAIPSGLCSKILVLH